MRHKLACPLFDPVWRWVWFFPRSHHILLSKLWLFLQLWTLYLRIRVVRSYIFIIDKLLSFFFLIFFQEVVLYLLLVRKPFVLLSFSFKHMVKLLGHAWNFFITWVFDLNHRNFFFLRALKAIVSFCFSYIYLDLTWSPLFIKIEASFWSLS